MKKTLLTLPTFILTLVLSAGSSIADDHEKKDIVDTAVAAGSFETLAAALQAADLVDALKGDGPFTVFAPTDEAFAKLPEGTVETLLKPENKDQLVDILTYHVVSGKVPAEVAVTLEKATALNEKDIKVTKKEDGLFLNESKVVKTDITCSNGVIHVIDTVLLPPADDESAMKPSGAARELIEIAIEKGVPLFNHGNSEACAAIYEVTAHALMAMPEGMVKDKDRQMLNRAIAASHQSHCKATNAWTFRHVFDGMLMASR
ncbi:MAG: fasciclin domain-containing protein [Verrucomicrobiota bacterium]